MSRDRRREKGTCSLYFDGTRWVVALELAPTGEGGRRRRRWTFRTEADAKTKAKAVQVARARLTTDAGRQTLATYLRRYLAVTAPEQLRPRTLAGYTQILTDYVIPQLGAVRLEALGVPHLRQWQHQLTTDGVSPRNRRYARTVLRTALQHAIVDGVIEQNPAAVLPMARAPKRKGRVLTLAELRNLLAACVDDPLGPFVRVVLGLGLRAGEALALRVTDAIQTPAGPMMRVERQVQRVKVGKASRLLIVPVKSDESDRLVPIHADVAAALEEQARQIVGLLKAAGPRWQEQGLLFPSDIGTVQDHRNMTRRWHRLRTRAGLGALRLHDLRHGYATLMRQSGTDLRTVSELLGHSGIGITSQFYGHLVPQLHEEAAARLSGLFDQAKAPASGEPMGSQSAADRRRRVETSGGNADEKSPAETGGGAAENS